MTINDSGAGLPEGFPDPEVMARMANEFFTALPEMTKAGEAASAAGAAPQVVPTEAQLRELPASLPRADSARVPAQAFSFLEEMRAFGAPLSAAPLPSAPSIKIPTETDVRDLAGLPGKIPAAPEAALPASMPPLPGAPAGSMPDFGGYSFLEDARGLSSLDVEPVLAPAGMPTIEPSSAFFDAASVRRDFPILKQTVNGRPLIWLDNAATTQKPQAVIDRLTKFYETENSNIHRAAHELAARATDAYEAAREKTRRFLNAPSVRDIIFVRGATEGINFIAQSWGRANIKEGDEILVSHLEHHANIVPWQQLCAQTGAKLRVAPVDDSGQIILEAYEKLLGPRTKIVSVTQVSNALGTVTPVAEMTALAHQHGICVVIDGAQAVSHMPVDVQAIGCDFYVFSGHKVFGPTGIGAVYGRDAVLAQTPPWQGGGNMIADVTFEKTVFQGPPERFEAGTGNIADAVGLGAAIDYVDSLGMANIAAYEHGLLEYATAKMLAVPRLKLIGTAREKASVLSFIIEGKETVEIGKALDAEGIAVRSGHHCAQPILRRFGLEATVRPSLAFYNTCEDVDALVDVLFKLQGRN